MTNHFSHKTKLPPNYPPVLEQAKKTYKIWLPILRNFPKVEQFGIGGKICRCFLKLLEILRSAAFSPVEEKILLLENALKKVDSIRFFLQLCWEAKLIPTKHYSLLGAEVENIGRQTGGWKKDLQSKTSP